MNGRTRTECEPCHSRERKPKTTEETCSSYADQAQGKMLAGLNLSTDISGRPISLAPVFLLPNHGDSWRLDNVKGHLQGLTWKLRLSYQGHVQPEENLNLKMKTQITQDAAFQWKSNFNFIILNLRHVDYNEQSIRRNNPLFGNTDYESERVSGKNGRLDESGSLP